MPTNGGLPCDFGVCPGSGFQEPITDTIVVGWTFKELVEIIGAAVFAWANAHQSRRLVTVTCKCSVIDLQGTGGAILQVTGVGTGIDFATARAAAYADAVRNAKLQRGRNSGFVLKHCDYWSN